MVDFIRQHQAARGYAPTIREVGEAVGLSSSSSAQAALRQLRDEGRIDWVDGEPRTLHIVEPDDA